MDLWTDLGTPKLPWGRLLTFIRHLPPDAASARNDLGPKARWGISEQILARVAWLLEVQLWSNADPKKRGPAPKPIETPWTAEQQSEQTALIQARLADLAERDRARRGVSRGD